MAPSAIDTFEDNNTHLSFNSPSGDTVKPSSHGGAITKSSTELIRDALREQLDILTSDESVDGGDNEAFFVADLGEVYRQHLRWKLTLPRVKPFYAVKCNPDPKVLHLLAELGTGFDCASKAEIEQVLGMGVAPDRIIYAHPCKIKSHVRYAARENVRQTTFDNADELYKVKQLYPNAELYLRILTDDSASQCQLSLKFGASVDSAPGLLSLAKDLDLNVVGVSFHVGSGASDPSAFRRAVQDARVVFDQAAIAGFSFHTLDVGGGFTGSTFESMASALNSALDEHFATGVRIIAEPGRYYVESAFTVAAHVIARRQIKQRVDSMPAYMLYLNDGIYGNFSSIMFDHQVPVPQVLSVFGKMQYEDQPETGGAVSQQRLYSLWGPTCDGLDCITQSCVFDQILDVGDWLYFKNMGAYTKCSATNFNGFTNRHDVIYVQSEAGAAALMKRMR